MEVPEMDDPRIKHLSVTDRERFRNNLLNKASNVSVEVREICAITCRVAQSFLRVGQLELFGRCGLLTLALIVTER